MAIKCIFLLIHISIIHGLRTMIASMNAAAGLMGKEYESPRWYRKNGVTTSFSHKNLLTSDNIIQMPLFTLDDGQMFPTSSMPMHIFAMKFRQMINNLYLSSNNNEYKMFGMVCSDGQGGFCEIGTGVEITERESLPDGRQLINVVGRQRFKIVSIIQEEPYIIAQVQYGVDDIDVPPSESIDDISDDLMNLEKLVYQLLLDIEALYNRLNVNPEVIMISDEIASLSPRKHPHFRKAVATAFSFSLCNMLVLTPTERQILLQSPSLHFRMIRIKDLLMYIRDTLLEKVSASDSEENAFE